ncbi:hypothetical protein ACVDG8_036915 (plasmid) [Mesorhizobium sp. ORM8.1]
MANDPKTRVRTQREARLLAGWHEIRTWVPTKEDADELLALADQRRKRAAHTQRSKGAEMKPENLAKILAAIANQGSKKYNTPSGPVLEALSDIAAQGDVGDVARGFQLFASAKPTNATVVAGHIPAKILNQYLFRHRGIVATAFLAWEETHKDWADRLKQALRNPLMFESAVDDMAVGITDI